MNRILIHALQSSGATLFAFFLSQRPNTLGILDLWSGHYAPSLDDIIIPVILKCAVCTNIAFEEQCQLFQPDVRILFTRDLNDVRKSLFDKYYRDDGGALEWKIQMARHLNPKDYDFSIDYREFLDNREGVLHKLGDLVHPDFYSYNRTWQQIYDFNCAKSSWCRDNFQKSWGRGNCRFPDRES